MPGFRVIRRGWSNGLRPDLGRWQRGVPRPPPPRPASRPNALASTPTGILSPEPALVMQHPLPGPRDTMILHRCNLKWVEGADPSVGCCGTRYSPAAVARADP
jgi:hypothetical protein